MFFVPCRLRAQPTSDAAVDHPTRRAVRRSQAYDVEVFDQIPTLDDMQRVLTAPDNAGLGLRKLLVAKMGDVAQRRLHPAAATMLELGEDEKITMSVSRSFHSL